MASLVVSGSSISTGSDVFSPRNIYTSLDRVRSYLSLASQQTGDDNILKEYIRDASRDIDEYCKRPFYPKRQTKRFDLPDDSQLIRFEDEELLEVYGLSTHNGASEVDSNAYWPRQGTDWNQTPYDRLELNVNVGSTLNFSGTPQRAIHIDGVWGFRRGYDDDGWIDSNASLTASISSGVTVINVTGSAGQNEFGNSPRFWDDQLWRIDDEYIHVVNDITTSRIRVIRGVNGTTATSHASGAMVETWDVEPDVEFCARELAAFEYMRSSTPRTGRVTTFLGAGGVQIEEMESIPPSIRRRLNRLRKRRVWSF